MQQFKLNNLKSELGGTLGLSAAIGSLTRVIAPISSGLFIEYFGVWSPGILGAILMALMAYFVHYNNLDKLGSKTTTKQE
jgi:hypothetical protein